MAQDVNGYELVKRLLLKFTLYIGGCNHGQRRVAKTCNEFLVNVPVGITPKLLESHVFHQYTIWVLDGKRD